MPVLEFALDGTSAYHVQVHINAHQGPISVMLNHNILGSLATMEEQSSGKDFRLPDNSVLRMCYIHGHLQAWRDGAPLSLNSLSKTPSTSDEEQTRSKLNGCALSLLLLNAFVATGLAVWFFVAAISTVDSSSFLLPQFGLVLINLAGLCGVFALLTWRRWGFYLAASAAGASFVLALVFGKSLDLRVFVLPLTLAILFWYLYSSGAWRRMR